MTTKRTNSKAPLTYPLSVSREEATRQFKNKESHHDNDSGDSDTTRFLRTMDAVLELYPEGWTITEILRLSEKWAIDSRRVMELWSSYKATMLKLNKIVEVATCLDEKMYARVR